MTSELSHRWYFRIGKVDGDQEVFCLLNDLDMLIAQQNDVLGGLLEDSLFSEELSAIRQQCVRETWGEKS